MIRWISVSQTYPYVATQLVHLGTTPIRKKPKRSIGLNLQRLNRPRVKVSIAIDRCKKRHSNLSNQLAQLGEIAGFRVSTLLEHYQILPMSS